MVSLNELYVVHCFCFLTYNNDLPKISNDNSKIVVLTEGTSIIFTIPSPTNFKNNVFKIFQDINSWFSTNLLSLNIDKTQCIQLLTYLLTYVLHGAEFFLRS
jgi:hypothetical protein